MKDKAFKLRFVLFDHNLHSKFWPGLSKKGHDESPHNSAVRRKKGMVINMKNQLRCVVKHQAGLGEGPLWDSSRQALFYVDITGKEIRRYQPQNGTCSVLKTEQMVGCIVPDGGGNLVAAEKNTLVHINPDTGERAPLLRINTEDYLRFNDGKCDADGRLWVGTMAADQTHPQAKVCGALYQIEDGKGEKLIFDRMAIPNGIAFDTENNFFYHIDTATQQICRYTLERNSGLLSEKQIVVTVPKEDGSPDGMTIDHEGMLWVALWGGYQVARYHPQTGEKLCSIPVPAKNVSCCTFGGENMNELFITTAMDEDGNGGELYACETKVHGFAPYPYQIQNGEFAAKRKSVICKTKPHKTSRRDC